MLSLMDNCASLFLVHSPTFIGQSKGHRFSYRNQNKGLYSNNSRLQSYEVHQTQFGEPWQGKYTRKPKSLSNATKIKQRVILEEIKKQNKRSRDKGACSWGERGKEEGTSRWTECAIVTLQLSNYLSPALCPDTFFTDIFLCPWKNSHFCLNSTEFLFILTNYS